MSNDLLVQLAYREPIIAYLTSSYAFFHRRFLNK